MAGPNSGLVRAITRPTWYPSCLQTTMASCLELSKWRIPDTLKYFKILYYLMCYNFQQKIKILIFSRKFLNFHFFQLGNSQEITKISIFVFNFEIFKKFPFSWIFPETLVYFRTLVLSIPLESTDSSPPAVMMNFNSSHIIKRWSRQSYRTIWDY